MLKFGYCNLDGVGGFVKLHNNFISILAGAVWNLLRWTGFRQPLRLLVFLPC